MARSSKHKLGARKMWIRRWKDAGRITGAEAKRFLNHLEQTGVLLKPSVPPASAAPRRGPAHANGTRMNGAPAGAVVTVQFDPSRFRIAFTAIRLKRQSDAVHK